ERGVHYYAMQFIDGHTLADVIAELRHLSGDEAGPQAEVGGPCQDLASGLASGQWAPAERNGSGGPPASAFTPPPGKTPAAQAVTPSAGALMTQPSERGRAFFRTVAHLGVQAAEALEHAHQLGVVHRDVKPANLLVDGRGHLWVTDFGLAQVQSDTRL